VSYGDYDLDPDDFDDEDEYEDAIEELERAEQEDEERRSRWGLRRHWRDLTGAGIFPGGTSLPGLPDPEWPADVDAWRAGSDGPSWPKF
jgi:hypothetical protein